jgi:hypothetical protein
MPTIAPGTSQLNVKKVVYINYRDVNWNDPGATVRAAVQAGYNVVILAFWLRTGTQTESY